uniref:Phosphatidylinositol glycan anchor biosynthesis class U protein n=1 Tax=Lepeophtheirus salmonis TaxID=72036 RepID=C1BTB5_LEPSM|nr:Phosphatidylinositol glycan anchor biosynthesis class U protein [Lepeophtheirus salmonis]
MTGQSDSIIGLVPYYVLGVLLRVGLWCLGPDLRDRVELSTPLNSHKRLVEGVMMSKLGYDPYSGVIVHETPLVLRSYLFLQETAPKYLEPMHILMDIATAIILQVNAKAVVQHLFNCEKFKKVHEEAKEITISPSYLEHVPKYTVIGFLCNPYIIANCVAKTTTTFHNLILSIVLLSMSKKQRFIGAFFLAIPAYLNLYTIMLLVPLVFSLSSTSTLREFVKTGIIFICFLTGLLLWSYSVSGSNFIHSVYGFILTVPELTPNMGLFWYFFTEMFEHFRLFFICTFQVNVFIYLIPLSIKLRKEPYLLSLTLLSLISIFKSYPSYGDVGFYLSLLSASLHLVPFMKQTFFVANMLLVTTVFGPILFQLWIYNGSANANYFFAINFVFGTAQIFLVTDVLFAQVKREFFLDHGFTKKNEQGKLEQTKLKLNSSF